MIRYSPRPLPATAYVPGSSPRADRPAESPPRTAVDVDDLAGHDDFRFGVDLFNHGFPWEAHEAWEPLWFAASRERPERALLHGQRRLRPKRRGRRGSRGVQDDTGDEPGDGQGTNGSANGQCAHHAPSMFGLAVLTLRFTSTRPSCFQNRLTPPSCETTNAAV